MRKWWGLVLWIFIVSCKEDKDPDVAPRLVSATQVGEIKKAEVLALAGASLGENANFLSGFLKYDVRLYKVTYTTTTTDGRSIEASGALVVPVAAQGSYLVSIQHGTLFNEADAPSYFKSGTESLLGIIMGASGYIAALPDYVGYGSSKAEPHPYEHAEGLAVPAVDFLFAVREKINEEGWAWNKQLFLAGYSAGGYATLATQKWLEEKYPREFSIKASSCGAGAYNKSLLLDEFITRPTAGQVNHNRSYIWVMQTYNRIYGLNKPMSYFFKEPYASAIQKEGHAVSITGSFNGLLQPEFIQRYTSGGEPEVRSAFKDNDLINWKTSVSTLLTHGDADTYVPYVNSTTALEGMQKAGSSQVSLNTVRGGTHESAIQDFILRTYLLFGSSVIN
jgi:pimeloyl-ACP methyl ester carboxylesterase